MSRPNNNLLGSPEHNTPQLLHSSTESSEPYKWHTPHPIKNFLGSPKHCSPQLLHSSSESSEPYNSYPRPAFQTQGLLGDAQVNNLCLPELEPAQSQFANPIIKQSHMPCEGMLAFESYNTQDLDMNALFREHHIDRDRDSITGE